MTIVGRCSPRSLRPAFPSSASTTLWRPCTRITRPGRDFTELRVEDGADPQAVLRAAIGRGDEVLHFEVADPSLEEVFVERVGALDVEERTLAPAEAQA